MKRVPDQDPQRREYQQQKWKAYTLATTGVLGLAPAAAIAILSGVGAFLYFLWCLADLEMPGIELYVMVVTCAVFSHIAIALLKMLDAGATGVERLSNPPVNPKRLPSREVLVRGASLPEMRSKTL